MAILGIINRTENWKTAYYFSPFFRDDASRLKLAQRLGEPEGTKPEDVSIELYWQGMRDYLHKNGGVNTNRVLAGDLAVRYDRLFPGLRERIEENREKFPTWLPNPQCYNYDVSIPTHQSKLYNNLAGTEIDIVLETRNHLFIGEAKHQSNLGANGKYVLVHQLIRQYVMAEILVDRIAEFDGCTKKKVIPFFVGDRKNLPSINKHAQVEFMIDQCWLKKENILSWDCVRKLCS